MQSTDSTPTRASPVQEAGSSSSDSAARCLPSPLAQLARQDHPQSADVDDARSHAAQLAATSEGGSPDSAAHKGNLAVAVPCLALPCLALPCLALPCLALPCLALPCLALPCPALPCLPGLSCLVLLGGQLTMSQYTPHADSSVLAVGMRECCEKEGGGGAWEGKWDGDPEEELAL